MISLVNVPRTRDRKRLVRAAEFFSERLMGRRLANLVDIKVFFTEGMLDKDGEYGNTCWQDRPDRSREFFIHVDRSLTEHMMLRTLAHEMVHVKQHASGELRCYIRSASLHRWKGEMIDDDSIKYRNLPWEKEAFSMEIPLVKEFKSHEAQANKA